MEDILKPKEEPKPLTERLKELEEKVNGSDKKPKTKSFKLPWKAKVGKAKAKKNWIGVIRLNENRTVTPLKTQIDEGVFEDKEGSPYLGLSDYVYYWKNKPVIFVHSGSFEPIYGTKLLEEAKRLNTLNVGRKLLKNHLERGQMELKKKSFGMGPIIILGILAAIGYFMYKSGVFGGG